MSKKEKKTKVLIEVSDALYQDYKRTLKNYDRIPNRPKFFVMDRSRELFEEAMRNEIERVNGLQQNGA